MTIGANGVTAPVEYQLLSLVQEFCKRKSLPIPTTVQGATDDLTLQLWGLLNEGVQDLGDRYNWQQLQRFITFTHLGRTDYAALLFGNQLNASTQFADWKFMLPNTLW